MPIACQALAHELRDIRLVGLRLTNLVSTASISRQTAMRYGLLERIKVDDFDKDEGEDEHMMPGENTAVRQSKVADLEKNGPMEVVSCSDRPETSMVHKDHLLRED